MYIFFFQAEDGIRDVAVTGVQTCALPISSEAALARLEELASEPWMHQGALSHTRDRYRLRTRHLRGHADGVLETPIEAKSIAHLRLARELLAVERRGAVRLGSEKGGVGKR